MLLVGDLLRMNAETHGGDTALVAVDAGCPVPCDGGSAYEDRRQSITWREFDDRANRVANYLNGIGIGSGDRVGLLLRNCLDWLPIYFGVLKSGAVVVPLNFRYTADDLVRCAGRVGLDGLIFGSYGAAQVAAGVGRLAGVRSFLFVGEPEDCPSFAVSSARVLAEAADTEPVVRCTPEQDAAIYFSSGTTGMPKPVVYTQATLAEAALREQEIHGQTSDDVFILIPPLYHVGGKLHWIANLLVGAPAVLLLGFSPAAFLETMARERVTIALLLLPWAQDLLTALGSGSVDLSDYELGSWRLLHMGAQDIPADVLKRLEARLPGVSLAVTYGLTESGGPGCLHLDASGHRDKWGSVGLPPRGWQVRIVDDAGSPAPEGVVGELCITGPGMMRCYDGDPEATSRTLRGGWLWTGDMAYRDPDGYVYVVGRRKDVVISGGENIWCVPIEDFLRGHGAVKDVAVFGAPDERMGEVVVALVQLEDGADCTERELIDWCEPLPRYERPRRIYFGPVPRNATGKVDKEAVRKAYATPSGRT